MAREALEQLFEQVWPGAVAAISRAEQLGWDWWQVSQPFWLEDQGRALAHVGVMETTLGVGGQALPAAAIHAVCTHRAHRRHGHISDLIGQALEHIDSRVPRSFLTTPLPGLFERHGFEVIPEHHWVMPVKAGLAGRQEPDPVDPDLLGWLCSRRGPSSEVLCARDPGWLLGICEVLEVGDLSRVHQLTELEAAVVWEDHEGWVDIVDVISEHPLRIEQIIPYLPVNTIRARLLYSPDLLAPEAEAVPSPSPDGTVFMVRGDWDLGHGPLALPPLARC